MRQTDAAEGRRAWVVSALRTMRLSPELREETFDEWDCADEAGRERIERRISNAIHAGIYGVGGSYVVGRQAPGGADYRPPVRHRAERIGRCLQCGDREVPGTGACYTCSS